MKKSLQVDLRSPESAMVSRQSPVGPCSFSTRFTSAWACAVSDKAASALVDTNGVGALVMPRCLRFRGIVGANNDG